MKFIHHIIIIILVGLCLYVLRDDVVVAFNHATAYVKGTILPAISGSHLSFTQPSSEKAKTSAVAEKSTPPADTPGPLRAAVKFLTSSSSDTTLSAQRVIELTNASRFGNGSLTPLKENANLDQSAQIKLRDMFNKQYFEHVSPDGVGVADLGERVGYKYVVIGENLALGNFKDDQALVDAWMASPGHRANILNTRYTEIGVAVGKGMYNGTITWLAVQHFGMPQSACPTIDDILRGSIEALEKDLKTKEADLATRRQMIDSGAVYQGMSHNEQINTYNQLIEAYNKLIISVKEKVATYNVQVSKYNACIGSQS
jgi:uncharacterized protein YkwD